MNHLRIATYDVTKGTSKEIAEAVLMPGGMRDIFKSQAGFQAYSLLEVDAVTVISISSWETHQEAEDAVNAAAVWVSTHLQERLHRTSNSVGDTMFWEGSVS